MRIIINKLLSTELIQHSTNKKLSGILLGTMMLVLMLQFQNVSAQTSQLSWANSLSNLDSQVQVTTHVNLAQGSANNNVYFVSETGNDRNSGNEDQPFRTIQRGINAVQPGGTVFVMSGTYQNTPPEYGYVANITKNGSANNWITISAYPGHTPRIVETAWQGFRVSNASYIEINGFELQCVPDANSNNSGNGVGILHSNHIRITNNEIYGCGGGGVYTIDSDYLTIENNVIHNTSHLSIYGNSAISIYHSLHIDTRTDIYKNIIRGNIVYNNENRVPFYREGRITDGNCIILDDLRNELYGATNPPYIGRSLIENNVCFNNGGRGIHVHFTDNVTVRNNTLYYNNFSPGVHNRQDHGELSAVLARNVEFYNNVVWARPGMRAFGFIDSQNISTWNNIVYGTNDLRHLGNRDIVQNPMFVNASIDANVADFSPAENSPLIDQGVSISGLEYDVAGNFRISGTSVDIGAYEYTGISPELPMFDSVVSSFILINADDGSEIMPLQDGMTLNLSELQSRNLSVIALTSPMPVGSVLLSLNGRDYMENLLPYALVGNDGDGYLPWSPEPGVYVISATPFSASNGTGQEGQSATITLTFVDTLLPTPTTADVNIEGFTLIDADSDNDIMDLVDGDIINLAELPSQNINMRVNTSTGVGSVAITRDNEDVLQNGAPFAVWNDTSGDYAPFTPQLSEYTISAVPYTSANAGGNAGHSMTITVRFINQVAPTPLSTATNTPLPTATNTPLPTATNTRIPPTNTSVPTATNTRIPPTITSIPPTSTSLPLAAITHLTLVDADSNIEMLTLQDGMTLNMQSLPTRNLNILANADANPVGSVAFILNDVARLENTAPFTLMGNQGNDYFPWTPEVGDYVLQVIPYSESYARGTTGQSMTISLRFEDQAIASPVPPTATNTPVPAATNTPVPVTTVSVERLILYNTDNGQPITTLEDGAVIDMSSLPTRNFNVKAETNVQPGSVLMQLNTDARLENLSPYMLLGDTGSWTPTLTSYTINAVPYTQSFGRGTAGQGMTVNVTFTSANNNMPTVEHFTLINADTDQPIMQIRDGDVIDLAQLSTRNLNVSATVNSRVRSVRFNYDNVTRVENAAPYAMLSDSSGDYNAWQPEIRAYTISAIPYSLSGTRGTIGTTSTINIQFVNTTDGNSQPVSTNTAVPTNTPVPTNTAVPSNPTTSQLSVTGMLLINADSDQPIRALTNGEIIDLSQLPTRNLNVSVVSGTGVSSVRISIDGGSSRTENAAPYAMWLDSEGDFAAWRPQARTYTFRATPYSRSGAQGTAGASMTISIGFVETTQAPVAPPATQQPVVVVPPTTGNTGGGSSTALAVTGFTLINADTNQAMGTITNGATINLSQLPTRNLNIRADLNRNAGSVNLSVNNSSHVENGAPFAIWSDDAGNYHVWQAQAGQYTISATPYTSGNLGGTQGTAMSLTFTIVDSAASVNTGYQLNVQVVGGGQVTRSVQQPTYSPGTQVTVSAVPNQGWRFGGWAGAVSGANQTASVAINGNTQLVATFLEINMAPPIVPVPTNITQRSGLNAQYFNELNFTGASIVRQDSQVEFNWGTNSPLENFDADTFSVRWWGWIVPTETATYTFYTNADDGTRLWVNNQMLFNDWLDHAPRENSATATLEAGRAYPIILDYYENVGGAQISLTWSSPTMARTSISPNQLFPLDPGPNPTIYNPDAPVEVEVEVVVTPEPIVEVPPETPVVEEPVVEVPVVEEPVVVPVTMVDLTLTSICAGQWQVTNANATPISFTWEQDTVLVRSAPIVAQPGDTLFSTGTAEGVTETVTIYFDLADGRGELTAITPSTMAACP
ncbi:MAG: PA14 domain-containing protein [Aggregatilineales bacterium]